MAAQSIVFKGLKATGLKSTDGRRGVSDPYLSFSRSLPRPPSRPGLFVALLGGSHPQQQTQTQRGTVVTTRIATRLLSAPAFLPWNGVR